jgi:hypothetical protein
MQDEREISGEYFQVMVDERRHENGSSQNLDLVRFTKFSLIHNISTLHPTNIHGFRYGLVSLH